MSSNVKQSSVGDWLAELAGGELEGLELRALLATRINAAEEVEQAAREVEVTRRVRALMMGLSKAEIEVPEGFETRLMAKVMADQTLLDLMELYLSGFGRALIELINLLMAFLPQSPEAQFAPAR